MYRLLETTLDELRQHTDRSDVVVPAVSAWSVGMHVEHCALAVDRMATLLGESVGPDGSVRLCPPVRWGIPRVFVTATGSIPRGKGKSPQAVIPEPEPAREHILAALDAAEARIETALVLPEKAWYHHHIFGPFRRDKVLWFMGVHNRHHLKIIRDILK